MRQASPPTRQESDSTRHLSAALAADASLELGERISAYLRARHPFGTPENVAADTGIKDTTVSKMLQRGSTPRAIQLFALMRAYGLDFLVAVTVNPPAWMIAARRAEEQAAIEQRIAELRSQQERL